MNSLQRKTVGVGCALLAGLAVLVGLGLGWEIYVYPDQQDATFSRLVWGWWAASPWSVWLASVLVAFTAGFFSGHFVSQSDQVYDAIRKGER